MTLTDWLIEYEPIIRMSFFVGMLCIMGIWEIKKPKRALLIPKYLRWSNNLGLVVLNSFLLRLVFPTAAVGAAVLANQHGWGVFNYYSLPVLSSIILSIIFMDLIIYLQHVLTHAVPLLWRLHRVHHADLDYDVTTGSRFHPIEIMISMGIKCSIILLLGPPIVAVMLFEIILNAMAMFNHGNVGLPNTLDRVLRWFIVTPDMHRIHHSIEDDEANSNFGFNLSCWDRLFGTYKKHPRLEGQDMVIGIRQFRTPKQSSWITGLLIMPFVGKVDGYAINQRKWSDPNI